MKSIILCVLGGIVGVLFFCGILAVAEIQRKEHLEQATIKTECVDLARLYCPADEQVEAVEACMRGVDLGIESFGNCEVER